MSELGGAWENNEILPLVNPCLPLLKSTIFNIKIFEKPDFVFLVFSGHGGYVRKETVFEINENQEVIKESELWNIAKRQITISDCCRGIEKNEIKESARMFSGGGKIGLSQAREIYDEGMMKADEQQARFYSCSIGEASIDTGLSEGGLYTKNLLQAINESKIDNYLTINVAHDIAAIKTKKEAYETEGISQIPDSRVIRCLSNKQLIIAVNTNTRKLFG